MRRAIMQNLNRDDLEALARTLPGPHAWATCLGNIFFCRTCHVRFELGEEPVPQSPCEPAEAPPEPSVHDLEQLVGILFSALRGLWARPGLSKDESEAELAKALYPSASFALEYCLRHEANVPF
jgi:hypothetical protein